MGLLLNISCKRMICDGKIDRIKTCIRNSFCFAMKMTALFNNTQNLKFKSPKCNHNDLNFRFRVLLKSAIKNIEGNDTMVNILFCS